MLNDFSEIGLSVVKNLNTRTLNISLTKLAENDSAILPANNYIPKIWENRWYNDDTVAGYQMGDIVWKWTMNENAFIKNYAGLIQKYAAEDAKLCSYFKYDASSSTDSQILSERSKYQNIISGYSEGTIVKYPPLFDYCYDYTNKQYNPEPTGRRIEIYISLKDDNKNLLSDTTSWKNVAIRTSDELSNYLSNEISSMMSQHIKDYHLGASKTYSDYDELLLAKDLSNFNINDAYNCLAVRNHDTYVNSQGIDYVVRFGKTKISTSVVPDTAGSSTRTTQLYKWYRLWSSSYLEHGGIIEVPHKAYEKSTDPSDYEIVVDLNWREKEGLSAPIYDYKNTSTSFYQKSFNKQYFAKSDADLVESNIDVSSFNIGLSNRYSISLTPVTFVSNDISAASQHIVSFDMLSNVAYPLEPNDDKNSTYINFEVFDQRNEYFKVVRSRTSDLRDLSFARYIQYYTTGYVAKPNRIYDINECVLQGFDEIYPYTGHPVIPTFDVYTNDGELLQENVDYIITFSGEHVEVGDGYELFIEGKYPWRGKMKKTFSIKYLMSSATHTIEGISLSYEF